MQLLPPWSYKDTRKLNVFKSGSVSEFDKVLVIWLLNSVFLIAPSISPEKNADLLLPGGPCTTANTRRVYTLPDAPTDVQTLSVREKNYKLIQDRSVCYFINSEASNIWQILCSDWLPGWARWALVARLRFAALGPKRKIKHLAI